MSAASRTRSQTRAHRYATALAIFLGLFFAGLINFTVAHTAGSTDATVVFGFKAWQAMFGCLLARRDVLDLGCIRCPRRRVHEEISPRNQG